MIVSIHIEKNSHSSSNVHFRHCVNAIYAHKCKISRLQGSFWGLRLPDPVTRGFAPELRGTDPEPKVPTAYTSLFPQTPDVWIKPCIYVLRIATNIMHNLI